MTFFAGHSKMVDQTRAAEWIWKNERSPAVILRLGEKSKGATACVHPAGSFAKPQNDKRWVFKWCEDVDDVTARGHPAGFFAPRRMTIWGRDKATEWA
jgi:hypothetical protein